ncbi:hypothetical protein DACRYDRAFT_107486 [Dacryopinax primogenitus]|uniref:Uncharacterized protein n=1 Tax=Dacryopinax primogenitus (strain DJM 731) TaxID=1858805 RepID=M5GCF9_DACPD|nr:uncharacterized protein DACRYDRAFT_107486 [Dacryopinax primogenitus]EJU01748.1 hypothetical protein DACRYDRAFT_107486 [Dacryopinax primogenitus]
MFWFKANSLNPPVTGERHAKYNTTDAFDTDTTRIPGSTSRTGVRKYDPPVNATCNSLDCDLYPTPTASPSNEPEAHRQIVLDPYELPSLRPDFLEQADLVALRCSRAQDTNPKRCYRCMIAFDHGEDQLQTRVQMDEDEEIEYLKKEMRRMKQETVISSQNVLRLAREIEEKAASLLRKVSSTSAPPISNGPRTRRQITLDPYRLLDRHDPYDQNRAELSGALDMEAQVARAVSRYNRSVPRVHNANDQLLSQAQKMSDKEIEAMKKDIRRMKQETVQLSRDALRSAREIEEDARITMFMLGDRIEKLVDISRLSGPPDPFLRRVRQSEPAICEITDKENERHEGDSLYIGFCKSMQHVWQMQRLARSDLL